MADGITADEASDANELRLAKQADKGGKVSDALIKKGIGIVAPEAKVAIKVAEMAGFDPIKWLKRLMIAGIIIQFVYIIGAILLITMALYTATESLKAVFTDPIGAFKIIWGILNPGTVEDSGPIWDIGGA